MNRDNLLEINFVGRILWGKTARGNKSGDEEAPFPSATASVRNQIVHRIQHTHISRGRSLNEQKDAGGGEVKQRGNFIRFISLCSPLYLDINSRYCFIIIILI